MRILATALIAICALASASYARTSVVPSPNLSPEDVISIQLKALSETENDPETNSGIARVWAFAHPSNRALTGPIERFTLMLKSPRYRALIGHRSHHMRQVSMTAEKAHYAIKITSSQGEVYGYSWHLGKFGSGDTKPVWMTTGVVLVGKLGHSL